MPVRAPQDGNVLVQMVSLLVVSSDGPDSSYIGKLVAAEREAVAVTLLHGPPERKIGSIHSLSTRWKQALVGTLVDLTQAKDLGPDPFLLQFVNYSVAQSLPKERVVQLLALIPFFSKKKSPINLLRAQREVLQSSRPQKRRGKESNLLKLALHLPRRHNFYPANKGPPVLVAAWITSSFHTDHLLLGESQAQINL